MKREYKQQREQLLFIFTKLHTDLVSHIIDKINFEKYDTDNSLRSIVKLQMMNYLLGDADYQYIFKNREMITIIREDVKCEFKRERELKRELKLKREREYKEKQIKYMKIGICIGTILFAYFKK